LSESDSSILRPAVFLDRDGTICEEVGYLNHLSRLMIYPWAAESIRRLNDAGLPVIVVTNQSGVSRGMFPESLVGEVHRQMAQELGAAQARLDAVYYCTHRREDNCDCRKPLPGLLQRAAAEHGIDLARSFVVGDRYLDAALARAVGGRGIMVMSGYGRGEYEFHHHTWPRQPDYVAEDLRAAVDIILKALP
jgi:D-glycero-D-manno-heptose 1,7-bisphosphate phosphatase